MITAMALVVPGSGFAGFTRGYRIISGPYAGTTFHADRDVYTPIGANVLVRFCPDDQFAREVTSPSVEAT